MEAPAEATNTEPTDSPSPRRLAGAVSLRDLEDGERRRRHRHERNRKRQEQLRIGITGAVVLALVAVGVIWRDLNRKHFAASEPLKYLGQQYELKNTDILRYAPLDARRDRQARKELDRALSDLASEKLVEQAEAIGEIRDIIKPRFSLAQARVRKEFPDMRETFDISIEDSTSVIKELTDQYNHAATVYNNTAAGFPASLIRPLFGYPEKLPPLRP